MAQGTSFEAGEPARGAEAQPYVGADDELLGPIRVPNLEREVQKRSKKKDSDRLVKNRMQSYLGKVTMGFGPEIRKVAEEYGVPVGVKIALRLIYSISRRATSRWFWTPNNSDKIFIFFGKCEGLRTDLGELEPMIGWHDVLIAGELVPYLRKFYRTVIATNDLERLEWEHPVVVIGGPLTNPLTKELIDQNLLPFSFQNKSYDKGSVRTIANAKGTESFASEVSDQSPFRVVRDVGFVARLRSPKTDRQLIYLIAGNYGVGTEGVVSHITSVGNLARLRSAGLGDHFQLVISTSGSKGLDGIKTECIRQVRV